MSGKKISEMTAITGAQLDQTNDVVPVLDVSDTSNPNKKISIQELAGALGGTTNVSLILDGSNSLILTDSDGNNVTADLTSLLDDTNTTNVSLAMNGNSLELTDSAASTISVDLSQFLDDTNTTNASLSLATNTLTLTDSASNSVDVDLSSLDNSGLTLADVTANGSVTGDQLLIEDNLLKIDYADKENKDLIKINVGDVSNCFELKTNVVGDTSFSMKDFSSSIGLFLNSRGNSYFNGGNIGIKTTTPAVTLDIQGTDAVQLTSGTTAERPTTPANGMIRYNSDDDVFEGYAGGAWGEVVQTDTSGNVLIGGSLTANNQIKSSTNNLTIGTGSSGSIDFRPKGFLNSDNRMRLQNTGRLAINSTGGGTTSPSVTLDINGTDAVQLTSGTTAERPTAAAGMIRFNTTTSKFEGYDGTAWTDLN